MGSRWNAYLSREEDSEDEEVEGLDVDPPQPQLDVHHHRTGYDGISVKSMQAISRIHDSEASFRRTMRAMEAMDAMEALEDIENEEIVPEHEDIPTSGPSAPAKPKNIFSNQDEIIDDAFFDLDF